MTEQAEVVQRIIRDFPTESKCMCSCGDDALCPKVRLSHVMHVFTLGRVLERHSFVLNVGTDSFLESHGRLSRL